MIGDIKERKRSSVPIPPSAPPSHRSGFPKAQHRSKKSAFLSSRESQSPSSGAVPAVTHVVPHSGVDDDLLGITNDTADPSPSRQMHDPDGIRAQVSAENERLVQSMTEEEREAERQEIYARFGPAIGDVLRRAREARERQNASSIAIKPCTPSKKHTLRFADVKSSEIYTYESQPSSPKKGPIALLPPPSGTDDSVIALNSRSSTPVSDVSRPSPHLEEHAPEEGTPEDIRRRYFPSARTDDPALAWISPLPSDNSSRTSPSDVRYDLAGDPIPFHLISTLPTHLGLHHHAGSLAGYTFSDLLLLSHSTVPAQRSTMLEVLTGVVRGLRTGITSKGEPIVSIPSPAECQDMRRKIVAVGVEALGGKGTTAVHAAEVVWEGIIAWDRRYLTTRTIGSVELEEDAAPTTSPGVGTIEETDANFTTTAKLVSDLPLPYLLPLIASHFKSPTLPPTSLSQLLQVLHRIALQSRADVHEILSTPDLIRSLISCFLLFPTIPSSFEGEGHSGENRTPDPLAVRVLTVLAESGKDTATVLIAAGIPDALLRFIAVLPPASNSTRSSSSPTRIQGLDRDRSIEVEVLIEILHFSRVLARYGLYSHVASTAAEPVSALTVYVISEISRPQLTLRLMRLAIVWLELLEAWMICATDPHCTTPPHDILWSQVVAWRWSEDILALREIVVSSLLSDTHEDSPFDATRPNDQVHAFRLWAAMWNAMAAWLEGATVNGARGGEEEKRVVAHQLSGGFSAGCERNVVRCAIDVLHGGPNGGIKSLDEDETLEQAASAAAVLHAMMRLAHALLPSTKLAASDSLTLPSPLGPATTEIHVPLEQIHQLCERLVAHPIWTSMLQKVSASVLPYQYAYFRPFTALLVTDLRLSCKIGGSKDTAWLVHAFRILSTALLPGDESLGYLILNETVPLIDASLVSSALPEWRLPDEVWSRGGIAIIIPFLSFALLPAYETAKSDEETDTPVHIAPYTTTPRSLILTTRQVLPSTSIIRQGGTAYGLPTPKDWPFAPLNDLLRSGTSKVFSTLTLDWTASETDVVRATLLFAGVVNKLLKSSNSPCHSEVIFACMRVFMLEHGQKQEDSAEEVFRDTFVSNAMASLLSSTKQQSSTSSTSLEDVSRRFLGQSTPFYQLYTDFLALYDAISFSDPLFASLLIPPLSMSYAPDYRKLFWNDFAHVLRTVRTEASHPAILDVGAFLWPVERSGDLVSAYLGALCRGKTGGGVHGILRLIAVHHVACHIWTDLATLASDSPISTIAGSLSPSSSSESSGSRWREDRAKKLLLLLVSQAPLDVLREVALYRQNPASDHEVLLPPRCFDDRRLGSGAEWRKERLELASRVGGESLRERLQGLFD